MSKYTSGRLEGSLADFIRRCEVCIEEEQRKPNAENHLISVFCDAIRITEEYEEYMRKGLKI